MRMNSNAKAIRSMVMEVHDNLKSARAQYEVSSEREQTRSTLRYYTMCSVTTEQNRTNKQIQLNWIEMKWNETKEKFPNHLHFVMLGVL